MKKKIGQKIFAWLLSFALLLNTASPLVQLSYAQDATPSATENTIIPTSTPAVTPTDSITPSPTPTSTPTPDETISPLPSNSAIIDINSTQSESSAKPVPSVWQTNTDGSVTTSKSVVLNQTYKAPQNDKVTATFSKLPENPGKLTIKEIKLTKEQIKETGALTDTAYDITSTMQDGTFEYTLTLPTPKTDNVEVKASEDGQNFVTVGGVTAQADTLTITGLNHFTIFVISADTTGGSYTLLTTPIITETAEGQVGMGSIILSPPSGFEFKNQNATASVGAATTGSCSSTSGGNKVLQLGTSTGLSVQTVPLVSGTYTFNVKTASKVNTCKLTFTGLEARPTSGTPLASGNISISGTSIITATIENATLTEVAGVVNTSQSTVSASSSSVAADGLTTSTITVTLKDQFGNKISGKNVSLASNRGTSDTVSAASGSSDSNGVVTFTVKSSTPGTSDYIATDTTDSVTITQTASVTFTDVTAPSTPGTPSTISPTNNNKPIWTWTASTDNVAVDHYVFYWGTTAGSEINNSGNISAGTTSFTHSTALSEGTWYGKVKAFDAAGNSSTSANGSVVVDNTAPTGTISINEDATYTNTTNVVLTFTVSETILQIELRNGTTGSFQNPISYESPHSYTLPIGDGVKTVAVRFTDAAGNKSTTAINSTIILDTTSPTLSQVIPVTTPTNNPQPSYTFNSSEAGTITYGGDCSGPTDATSGNNTINFDYLSDDVHNNCIIQVTDAAGNTSNTLNITPFTVDTTGPDVTAVSINPIQNNYIRSTVTVSANVTDSVGVSSVSFRIYDYDGLGEDEVSCDGVQDTNDPTLWSCQLDTTSLSEETSYDVEVTANDTAGNTNNGYYSDNEDSFYVDNTAPQTSDSGTDANWHSSDVTITLSCSDDNSGCANTYYTTDGSTPTTSSASGNTITLTNNGQYTIKYFSTDYAGNAESVKTAANTVKIIDSSSQILLQSTTTVTDTNKDIVVGGEAFDSTVNIPSTVTDATLNLSNLTTVSGTTKTATLSNNIILSADTTLGTIKVELPSGIQISGNSTSWDTGKINIPTLQSNSSVTAPAASGFTTATTAVVEVGFGDVPLTFNKGVRVLLVGQAGKLVGYSRSGVFTQITNTCSADTQAAGDALNGGDCYINVGSDIVVWTQHFTKFVTYTQTSSAISTSTSSGGGGGTGDGQSDGLGCGSHDCSVNGGGGGGAAASQTQVLGASTQAGTVGGGQVLGSSTEENQPNTVEETSTTESPTPTTEETKQVLGNETTAPESTSFLGSTAGKVAIAVIILIILFLIWLFFIKKKE